MRRSASCRSALAPPSGHPAQHTHTPTPAPAPTLRLPRLHNAHTCLPCKPTITGLRVYLRLPLSLSRSTSLNTTLPGLTGARQYNSHALLHGSTDRGKKFPDSLPANGQPPATPVTPSMTKFVDGARQSGKLSGAPSVHPTKRAISGLKVSNRLRPSAGARTMGCGVGPLTLSARLVGGARGVGILEAAFGLRGVGP